MGWNDDMPVCRDADMYAACGMFMYSVILLRAGRRQTHQCTARASNSNRVAPTTGGAVRALHDVM